MPSIARLMMIAGAAIFLAGGLLYLLGKTGMPLGRLPGDLRIQGENMTCFIPLATSILLSILLTVILNVVVRYLNR